MTKESKVAVAIDVAGPTRTIDWLNHLAKVCKDYDLEITGMNPSGPAGGNPRITFRGKLENLKRMLMQNGYEDVDRILSAAS